MALAPGHTASHTSPEGKPGIQLTALGTWLVPAAERRHTGLRAEVLVGMLLSHLRGHLVAQQPQSQVLQGQQSMGAPLPHGEAAPLQRAWNHSSLGKQARSAALATRIFVHETQTGTNWSHRAHPHWKCRAGWLCKPPATALSKKVNSKFLFSHGFHPDPLCTWF